MSVKIIFSRLFVSRFALVGFVLRQGNLVWVKCLHQGCEVLLHGFNGEIYKVNYKV